MSSSSLPMSSSGKDSAVDFSIRAARSGDSDVLFILDCFDSTLTFLAGIGSGEQWGARPFSKRPEMVQFIQDCVISSNNDKTDQNAYIVEKRGEELVPCGAVIVDSSFPDYLIENNDAMKNLADLTNFLYLNVLVTHKGPSQLAKGAGDALIDHVKAEARRRNNQTILVDCWNGNDGALIR